MPVAGIDAERIPDTFDAPRAGGRRHNATDIMARRGTPVVAADDGLVISMRRNRSGGITLYATDAESRFVYYYAHLSGYREGVREGTKLAKGDVIGYVGTSGNAPKDAPHLHFQLMRMPADGRYWAGTPIDARPFLVETVQVESGGR
ncbi:MAG TPA: M23 family metallopeptidase [Gemmatimonadaceae bacterium]|nr:M23 family metallopeptidase [Gemmatimonadaceae bacterium]